MYLEFLLLAVILCIANAVQCPWGKFGDNCERDCSYYCASVKNGAVKHCNKSTGECSEGCIAGYHGVVCSTKCSENCLNKICNQHNGHCTQGCIENYRGKLCNIHKDFSNSDNCTKYKAVLGSFLGISLVLNIIAGVVLRKRILETCKLNFNARP